MAPSLLARAALLAASTLAACAAPASPPGAVPADAAADGAGARDAGALVDLAPACLPAADHCPPGRYCDVTAGVAACLPGCKSDGECQSAGNGTPTSACCAHACDETSLSKRNCGRCGAAVPAGQACCAGLATDVDTDPMNCGDCGQLCRVPNAVAGCSGGGCTVGSCLPDYGDCNRDPLDGCEAHLPSDVDNCGACGRSCLIVCINGFCI